MSGQEHSPKILDSGEKKPTTTITTTTASSPIYTVTSHVYDMHRQSRCMV